MAKVQKTYTREFKEEAVRLAQTGGKPITQVAREMRYQFIEQNKQEFPVVVMCGVLEVSESGYYAWLKRPICQRQREDAQLVQKMRQVFVYHHRNVLRYIT